jgi:chemotaxis-related protein WspB
MPELQELFLKFQVGGRPFVLAARDIEAVLPSVAVRPIENAPTYVVGLLDYQGRSLPLIDLCQLSTGAMAVAHYSTRILLVRVKEVLLALRAEQVTELIRTSPTEFQPLPVSIPEACLTGAVARVGNELVARVDPGQLLSPEISRMLLEPHG